MARVSSFADRLDHRWAHFLDAQWNVAPGVLRGWPVRRLSSQGGIVRGFARIARQHRSGRLSTGVHVYTGRGEAANDVGRWLPRAAEPAARYFRRICSSDRNGVVVAAEDYQRHSPAVDTAVQRFLEGLTARIGAGSQRTRVLACLGNFLELPYGLHPSGAHNFLVVGDGRATVRVWARGAFRGARARWLHRTDYASMLDGSVLLDGRAGDILYWPAGSWHVNEGTTRRPSFGVNILLFPQRERARSITSDRRPSRSGS